MRRIALLVVGLLMLTLAGASTALACECTDYTVEDSSKVAASIFIGEIIDVGEPREVKLGDKTEKLYLTKFFVQERWKGPKSVHAEVLTDLPSHYGLSQMRAGMVLLVYAFPLSIPGGSSNIEGLVISCSRTTFFNNQAFADVFALDKIFKSKVSPTTPLLWPSQQMKKSCLVWRS
jgi:hypothetical protein